MDLTINLFLRAVLPLWWLVAGLSPRRFGFYPRPVHVGSVVYTIALRHVFSPNTSAFPCQYRCTIFFKVRKSVHHPTIQINHHPDATIFQFIILTFIYSSTCFGRFPAYHQELSDCSSSLWFYLRIVVAAVLCSWSDRPA